LAASSNSTERTDHGALIHREWFNRPKARQTGNRPMSAVQRLLVVSITSLLTLGLPFPTQAQPSPGSMQDAAPTVRPVKKLRVQPAFSFDKKTRKSVSGIACGSGGDRKRCLVVFDEGRKVQLAVIGPKRMESTGQPFKLTATEGELDAEGATAVDGVFFVTGSHAVKRESCKVNPASRAVVRFSIDANALPQGLTGTSRLWRVMQDDTYLGAHAEACLGNGPGGAPEQLLRRPGLNIEGLAALGGRLYFGFRGPSENGMVPILSVNAAALFDGGDAEPKLVRVLVGQHVGVRDMAATSGSILLLLGPDDFDAGADARWKVAEWRPEGAQGASALRVLATLDARKSDIGDACFDALKPEAVAVLDESTSRYRVVVLSDGVCDGGPLVFDIPR
jgi:Protein of unknown function (DUF3616)